MSHERVIQQVSGILGMNEINFQMRDDKQGFLVPYGSAGVFIEFFDWGEGTGINIRAAVLEEVDASGDHKQKIFEALNKQNGIAAFGRLHFDEDQRVISLDHQLLGDRLDGEELMNGLSAVATRADQLDDELREAIGSGVRAEDLWNRAQKSATAPGPSGPVVDA